MCLALDSKERDTISLMENLKLLQCQNLGPIKMARSGAIFGGTLITQGALSIQDQLLLIPFGLRSLACTPFMTIFFYPLQLDSMGQFT